MRLQNLKYQKGRHHKPRDDDEGKCEARDEGDDTDDEKGVVVGVTAWPN